VNIKDQLNEIDLTEDLRPIITIHGQLYKDIIKETAYLNTAPLRQRIWHILNTKNPPLCLHCNKTHTRWKEKMYRTYCSKTCANKDAHRLAKVEKTNIEKYGVKNVFQSKRIKKQIIQSNIKRYGVENPSQSEEIKNQKKKSSQKKYGTNCVLQSHEVKDKIKKTNLSKYGVEHFSYKNITQKTLDKLNNTQWLKDKYVTENMSILDISKELNISHSTVYLYIKKHNFYKPNKSSTSEIQLRKICEATNLNIQSNCRNIIPPYELDILITELNLAIEYNGLYWHSELFGKNKDYHLNKTKLCNEKGIRLIHIFEHEWLLKQDIIKSRINSLLNNTTKIYARNCIIKLVSKIDSKTFLNNNHIQGNVGCKYSYGLYNKGVLVSLMTFGEPRFNKMHDYELLRFCSLLDHTIVGGASKLFKHFTKTHKPKSVISYCDIRYGTGNVYKKLDFEISHITKPNYWYFNKNDCLNVYSRIKFQKHKLKKLLPIFDENLTEWENMQNNGWNRFWDCGNSVWTYSKH